MGAGAPALTSLCKEDGIMLYYIEACSSPAEVPNERSLCIYITGCLNHCDDCHYPELRYANYGELLSENIHKLIELYFRQITCVCFLGEGMSTKTEKDELVKYVDYAHARGLKACLYSGRNINVEAWMKSFDYIKLGAFDVQRGALGEKTTNQVMLRKTGGEYQSITAEFWK